MALKTTHREYLYHNGNSYRKLNNHIQINIRLNKPSKLYKHPLIWKYIILILSG